MLLGTQPSVAEQTFEYCDYFVQVHNNRLVNVDSFKQMFALTVNNNIYKFEHFIPIQYVLTRSTKTVN